MYLRKNFRVTKTSEVVTQSFLNHENLTLTDFNKNIILILFYLIKKNYLKFYVLCLLDNLCKFKQNKFF